MKFFLVRLQFFVSGIINVLGFELILSPYFLRILDDVEQQQLLSDEIQELLLVVGAIQGAIVCLSSFILQAFRGVYFTRWPVLQTDFWLSTNRPVLRLGIHTVRFKCTRRHWSSISVLGVNLFLLRAHGLLC